MWRERVPFQLALGDDKGGVRAYSASRVVGAVRSFASIDERWAMGRFTRHGAVGIAISGPVGSPAHHCLCADLRARAAGPGPWACGGSALGDFRPALNKILVREAPRFEGGALKGSVAPPVRNAFPGRRVRLHSG